jgi:hypothetical protein
MAVCPRRLARTICPKLVPSCSPATLARQAAAQQIIEPILALSWPPGGDTPPNSTKSRITSRGVATDKPAMALYASPLK